MVKNVVKPNEIDQKKSIFNYTISSLQFSDNFKGVKHDFNAATKLNNTTIKSYVSFLNNNSSIENNDFLRVKGKVEHSFKKSWIGGFTDLESNERTLKSNQLLSNLSHRFKEFETYFGIGDSTKTYTKIGFNYRENDSIRNHQFTNTNTRKTIYINSRLLQNKRSSLSIFANYRTTKNTFIDDVLEKVDDINS